MRTQQTQSNDLLTVDRGSGKVLALFLPFSWRAVGRRSHVPSPRAGPAALVKLWGWQQSVGWSTRSGLCPAATWMIWAKMLNFSQTQVSSSVNGIGRCPPPGVSGGSRGTAAPLRSPKCWLLSSAFFPPNQSALTQCQHADLTTHRSSQVSKNNQSSCLLDI